MERSLALGPVAVILREGGRIGCARPVFLAVGDPAVKPEEGVGPEGGQDDAVGRQRMTGKG